MNYHFEQIDETSAIACLNNISTDEIKEIISIINSNKISIINIIENDAKPSNNGRYYIYKIILTSPFNRDKSIEFKRLVEGLLLSFKRGRKSENNFKGDFDSLYNLNMKLFDKISQLENSILLNNERLEQIAERNKLELEYIIKSKSTDTIDNSAQDVSIKLEEANKIIDEQKIEIENKNNELIAKNELIIQKRIEDLGLSIPKNVECGVLVFGQTSLTESEISNIIETNLTPYCKPKIEFVSTSFEESKKRGKVLNEKFKSGKYKFLIFGPAPHSIENHRLRRSVITDAQANNILCHGSHKDSINKSQLQIHLSKMIQELYNKEN